MPKSLQISFVSMFLGAVTACGGDTEPRRPASVNAPPAINQPGGGAEVRGSTFSGRVFLGTTEPLGNAPFLFVTRNR